MPYVATINIPGYLPQDDELHVFDTARGAWEYLAEERERSDDIAEDKGWGFTYYALVAAAEADVEDVIYGPTYGDGDTESIDSLSSHDLGLAYSVTELSEEDYYLALGRPLGPECPGCGQRRHVTRMTGMGFHCATEDQGYCNFECICDAEEDGEN